MKLHLLSSGVEVSLYEVVDAYRVDSVAIRNDIKDGQKFSVGFDGNNVDVVYCSDGHILQDAIINSVMRSNIGSVEICEASADFVEKSGIKVVYDKNLGIVTFESDDDSMSLNETDSENFIVEVNNLFERLEHITLDRLYLALAKPYVENCFE
ncbi:hypothetical protein [Photobacterium leiognathi]|uniref:hypothetical protein n=1 Tax=Photobacterium leiognathi TaxID=553611 RepID=UPI002982729A|nr:hypothetical protein [Photobacterium leiognathi]